MNIIFNKFRGEKNILDFINKFRSRSLSKKKWQNIGQFHTHTHTHTHIYTQGDEFASFLGNFECRKLSNKGGKPRSEV